MAVVRRLDPAVAAGHERRADARLLPDLSEEQRRLRAEWLHTCYEPAIQRAYDDFHQVDSHRDYPLLTLPTLLIAAGKGGVIQPKTGRRSARCSRRSPSSRSRTPDT